MAKQEITTLIDDLDGSPADETVMFGLDGTVYQVDLSAVHAEELRTALEPFRAAGRRVSKIEVKANGHKRVPSKLSPADAWRQNERIREWARASHRVLGLPAPSGRGRIQRVIVDAYNEHGGIVPKVDAKAVAAGVRERLDKANGQVPEPAPPPAKKAAKKAATKKAPAKKAAKKAAQSNAEPLSGASPARTTAAQRKELNKQIRTWARSHGEGIGDHGKLPAEVIAAYDANDPNKLPCKRFVKNK